MRFSRIASGHYPGDERGPWDEREFQPRLFNGIGKWQE